MKGIYIEIPVEDIENLDRLSERKASRVSIIRNLLILLRGMNKNSIVIAFDDKNIKLMNSMKEPRNIGSECTNHEFHIFYNNGKVTVTEALSQKMIGGGAL
jgi:hypothetical protein